uniref:DUF4258 domain-containing protein n=1 Tax=Fastidiosibacter lacustris TaxID=2056695 RepID=UPI001300881E
REYQADPLGALARHFGWQFLSYCYGTVTAFGGGFVNEISFGLTDFSYDDRHQFAHYAGLIAANVLGGIPKAGLSAIVRGGKAMAKVALPRVIKESVKAENAAKASHEAGKIREFVTTVANGAEHAATGFKGNKGFELKNSPYQKVRNKATTINGRDFSGHALDQMQNRGIMPSVVENTIKTGQTLPTKAGTTSFYDLVNNVRVITNSETGRIVTVIRGVPN